VAWPVPSAFVRRIAELLLVLGGLVSATACGGNGAGGRPSSASAVEPKVLGRTYERPSVDGIVRRDGVAVAGAQVSLEGVGRSTVTDASGSYRFEAVAAGTYRLVVSDAGDDTPVCASSGACVTAESARHAATTVVVVDQPMHVDVDL
jgi:carboxypeptidase family protein